MSRPEGKELRAYIKRLGGVPQEEADAAALWLGANSYKLDALGDQAGGVAAVVLSAAKGDRVAVVSVVSLGDEDIAGFNNHAPNDTGREALLPWPGPDSVRETSSMRPVEDQIIDEDN